MKAVAVFIITLAGPASAFAPVQQSRSSTVHADKPFSYPSITLNKPDAIRKSIGSVFMEPKVTSPGHINRDSVARNALASCTFALLMFGISVSSAFATDFAKKDISGQDLSGQDLSNKDFTSVIAKSTNFAGANLEGSNFEKANLEKANFSGSNLIKVNFVDAKLDNTIFKNAKAQDSRWGVEILDVGDFEGADLTNSIWPSKYRIMICDMDVVKGTNPETGVSTYSSLFCSDDYSR